MGTTTTMTFVVFVYVESIFHYVPSSDEAQERAFGKNIARLEGGTEDERQGIAHGGEYQIPYLPLFAERIYFCFIAHLLKFNCDTFAHGAPSAPCLHKLLKFLSHNAHRGPRTFYVGTVLRGNHIHHAEPYRSKRGTRREAIGVGIVEGFGDCIVGFWGVSYACTSEGSDYVCCCSSGVTSSSDHQISSWYETNGRGDMARNSMRIMNCNMQGYFHGIDYFPQRTLYSPRLAMPEFQWTPPLSLPPMYRSG